jgi:hypothetical protein
MKFFYFNRKMKIIKYLFPISILFISSCFDKNDSGYLDQCNPKNKIKDSIIAPVNTKTVISSGPQVNDTLTELAELIAGTKSKQGLFSDYSTIISYKKYAENIENKWRLFDSTKLKPIETFSSKFLIQHSNSSVFYPFSGPDILYASTLFSNLPRITMIGLEPVGTLPIIDDKNLTPDSIHQYCDKISQSLFAILNFSFFRTVSMKEDLRSKEVDGSIHLLLMFLSRTGHKISSIKPFYIDSLGKQIFVENTITLNKKKYKNPSIEIVAIKNNLIKTITYTSSDISDIVLNRNIGLQYFILNTMPKITYLKGASYLMHKSTFSKIRNLILDNTNTIVQDDSGVGIKYILSHKNNWEFSLFGNYTKPINMFKDFYQLTLDSLYKNLGSKPLGFGMGYNYRDRNSNFMIIKKVL